ncbi:hypothetical protein ABIB45_001907 [Arthrobacter sp. UYCo732]
MGSTPHRSPAAPLLALCRQHRIPLLDFWGKVRRVRKHVGRRRRGPSDAGAAVRPGIRRTASAVGVAKQPDQQHPSMDGPGRCFLPCRLERQPQGAAPTCCLRAQAGVQKAAGERQRAGEGQQGRRGGQFRSERLGGCPGRCPHVCFEPVGPRMDLRCEFTVPQRLGRVQRYPRPERRPPRAPGYLPLRRPARRRRLGLVAVRGPACGIAPGRRQGLVGGRGPV